MFVDTEKERERRKIGRRKGEEEEETRLGKRGKLTLYKTC